MIATESRKVEAGAARADMVGHWAVYSWEASLPYTVGVNRVRRHGRGRTFKSKQALIWQTATEALLWGASLRA
jgi:hypothetical protein